VYTVGFNGEGRNGTGTGQDTFTKVDIRGKVVNVFAGGKNCFVILEDGTVYAWGNGGYGQLGNDQGKSSLSPVLLNRIDGVSFISAGSLHTGILTNTGDYWAAGRRNFGALGAGSNTGVEKKFLKITGNVVSAAVGSNYTMVIKEDGALLTSGAGDTGGQGTGAAATVSKLTQNLKEGTDNARVFTGYLHTLLLKKDGRLMAAGYNNSGQTSNEEKAVNTQLTFQPMVDAHNQIITGVSDVSLGRDYTVILKKDGTLWGVGSNEDNKLGLRGVKSVANAVPVLDHVASAAAGVNHTLAVTEDGSLWAAGRNGSHQYGDKFISSTEKPGWTKLDISSLK
jgi:alpha-tubulin suppressor-like RCC1 family protein